MATNYLPIDDTGLMSAIDSNHITIEGADVSVRKISKKEQTIHPNDYLGVGTPIYER